MSYQHDGFYTSCDFVRKPQGHFFICLSGLFERKDFLLRSFPTLFLHPLCLVLSGMQSNVHVKSIRHRNELSLIKRHEKEPTWLIYFNERIATYTMLVSAGKSGMSFNCWRMQRTVRCWHKHLSGHPIAFAQSSRAHSAISTIDSFLFTSFILRCWMIPSKCTVSFLSPTLVIVSKRFHNLI